MILVQVVMIFERFLLGNMLLTLMIFGVLGLLMWKETKTVNKLQVKKLLSNKKTHTKIRVSFFVNYNVLKISSSLVAASGASDA